MSDPDRRHSSGASDYDAIFADIVAHLNDDLTEAEQPVRPAARDGDSGNDSAVKSAGDSEPDEPTDPAARQMARWDQEAHEAQPDHEDQEADPAQATESVDLPQEVPLGERDPWSVPLPPLLPRPEDLRDPAPDEDEPGPTPQVWRAHEVDDDEGHFEPPAATPLPAGDLQFWAIIAGMGAGPLLLLYLVFFNRDASGYWILTAIALFVGGFALLVSRMPGNHEDDDNGARL